MTTIANALLGFLMHLLRDPDAAEKFREDPDGELHRAGLHDVHTDDVDAVLPVVLDYAPMRVDTSFDRGHGAGGTWAPDATGTGGGSGRWERHDDGGRGWDHGDRGGEDDRAGHGPDDDHDHAVTQLTHIVNNYAYTSTVDDRDTVTDQSVHQNVWADGDVLQWFDNDAVVASGDEALAAGGDVHVDGSTDSSTHVAAHDSTVEVGATDLDVELSFDDDHSTDSSDHFVDVTEDSFNNGSDHSTDLDLDLTDAFNDHSTDVDVDLEDSFTQDDDGIDVKEADVDVDASDSSTHDTSTTITDNEVGTTDISGNVVVTDNEVGTTDVEDNVVVHDSFDDNFSDNVGGNELGPDGLGDVPG